MQKVKSLNPAADALKELMQKKGISGHQLAQMTGVYKDRIYEILNGERVISPDTACRLAIALGKTPLYWLQLQAISSCNAFQASLIEKGYAATSIREAYPDIRPVGSKARHEITGVIYE